MTLYRKYRPQKFSDLVGQDHVRDTLLQAVKESKLSQAYLFTGPRGTGKTTTARLLAKVANCQKIIADLESGKEISGEPCGECDSCLEITAGRALDIIEIDAASNRGIDEIRELREQVKYSPSKSKFKIYIIDEVHMLTREAFNALLKTLEEPPAHAIFVLATTEPHKVLPTIISRTQRFDFKRIPPADLVRNMKSVLQSEKIKAEDEALETIANLAEGGGRDSLTLLEQVITYSNTVDMANVKVVLGIAELSQIVSLLRAIFSSRAEEGLKIAHSLYSRGLNLGQLNASILDVLRKLLNLAVAESFLASDTKENRKLIQDLFAEIKNQYGDSAQSKILATAKSFIDAGKIMKETIDPLVAIEIAVVESIDATNPKSEIRNPKQIQIANDQKIKPSSVIPPEALIAGQNHEKKIEDSPVPRNDGTRTTENKKSQTSNNESVEKSANDNLAIKPSNNNETTVSLVAPEERSGIEQSVNDPLVPLSELSNEIWRSVIGEVKKENSTLAALLKDAKPMTVDDGKLVLGVRFKFHKDKISEDKNVRVLEGVICNVTGNSCRVYCEIADFSNQKPKESHSDDELAKEAEKVFGEEK